MNVPCANHGPEKRCSRKGQYTCKQCMLVTYCSATCQKTHWNIHKQDCNSDLTSKWWKPEWHKEDRTPQFVGPRGLSHFGGDKFLWGNSSAYDILNLDKNEGLDYDKDLDLLFAASEDLRNVIMTVTNVPDTYKKQLKIVVNDFEFDITARNLICLLIMLLVDDADEASNLVTHLWYSSHITKRQLTTLQTKLLYTIGQCWAVVSKRSPGKFHTKKWTAPSGGTASVRINLLKSEWKKLPPFLRVPQGLTSEAAHEMRRKITLAPGRVDWRERIYCKFPPSLRLGYHRFREDGLLLPFGADRRAFTVPNPTMFHQDQGWPMRDASDPMDGWNPKAVNAAPCGPSTSDRYGKLYYFLKARFREFHRKIRVLNIEFDVWNMETEDLILQLKQGRFARVEMANVCDTLNLGLPLCLSRLGPLLQRPAENRYATMTMVFVNAVDDVMDEKDIVDESKRSVELRKKYLRITTQENTSPNDPSLVLGNLAFYYFLDVNKYFDRYMRRHEFRLLSTRTSMEMKPLHTVIEKWPLKLKKKFDQPGSEAEFNVLFQSGQSCTARYMEWKRKQ